MNEKLNIQDLIDTLAERHGMSKKNADSFVKEFFQLIEESLEKDKYVKIRGLGTFKLIDVGSRESVNVNTGERFEIQGHTKVSFTPEPTLKDIINRPFSHFETVVLNDATVLEDTPLENDSEDEEEAVAATGEPVETVAETFIKAEKPLETVEETVSAAEEPIETVEEAVSAAEEPLETVEETVSAAEEPLETVEETVAAAEKPLETVEETAAAENVRREKRMAKEKADLSTMRYFIGIVVFIMLLCGGAIVFMYYPDLLDKPMEKPQAEETAAADANKAIGNSEDMLANNESTALADSMISYKVADSLQIDTVAEESLAAAPAPKATPVPQATPKENMQQSQPLALETGQKKIDETFRTDSVSYRIAGTETTHTIQAGETLGKVALRFYGTKAPWPYIVKHNPGVIKNPNNVPSGTTIKIPKLVRKQ